MDYDNNTEMTKNEILNEVEKLQQILLDKKILGFQYFTLGAQFMACIQAQGASSEDKMKLRKDLEKSMQDASISPSKQAILSLIARVTLLQQELNAVPEEVENILFPNF